MGQNKMCLLAFVLELSFLFLPLTKVINFINCLIKYLGHRWIIESDIRHAISTRNSIRLSYSCRPKQSVKHNKVTSFKNFSLLVKLTSINLPPRIDLVYKNNTLTMEGFCGELFSIFIANFNISFEVSLNKDKAFGILDADLKWNGMMGDVIYGIADIAPCVSTSRTRRDYLVFSPALYTVRMEIIHLKLNYYDWDFAFFLKPYNQTIWLTLAAISLIIILSSFYTNYIFTGQSFSHCASGFSNEILLCWPIVLQSKLSVSPLYSIKFCLGIYLVFSLLILSIYTSLLTALFATSKMKIPFFSLEDMVYETDYLPVILRGSTIQDFFEKSFKNRPFVKVNDATEGINNVVKRKAGFIMSLEIASTMINNNCSFSLAPKYVYTETISLAYSKTFPHMEFFNTKLLELREHGIISAVHNRHIMVSLECLEGNILHYTSFRQIIGPVVLFACGVLISIVVGIVEILCVVLKVM
uniref:Ionotropic glutamate receptor L-glutamate and glycine-binding domain-containing protein n=1 Tax=Strigamia maritima TaxID=126957 RepID=T1IWG2_STRMM